MYTGGMTATEGIAQVSSLATRTALSLWSMADDFIIVLILFGILFLFAWYVGRGPFVALLLSFYAAYAIYVFFPYTSFLPTKPPMTAFLGQAGLYAALALVFFLILRRTIVSDFLYIGILGLAILSFLGAAFLIAVASHIFLVTSFYEFTPAVSALFTSSEYFFWWFSGPAIGLLFFAR
jgi:hypothetical protein